MNFLKWFHSFLRFLISCLENHFWNVVKNWVNSNEGLIFSDFILQPQTSPKNHWNVQISKMNLRLDPSRRTGWSNGEIAPTMHRTNAPEWSNISTTVQPEGIFEIWSSYINHIFKQSSNLKTRNGDNSHITKRHERLWCLDSEVNEVFFVKISEMFVSELPDIFSQRKK